MPIHQFLKQIVLTLVYGVQRNLIRLFKLEFAPRFYDLLPCLFELLVDKLGRLNRRHLNAIVSLLSMERELGSDTFGGCAGRGAPSAEGLSTFTPELSTDRWTPCKQHTI